MKIGVAQTRPVKGDISGNIDSHKGLVDLAVANGAETLIFPELSITGYEPTLAKDLATHQDDRRLEVFQTISDARQITIGVGVPTTSGDGVCISLMLFQPHRSRQVYAKQHLHPDEEPFFVRGPSSSGLIGTNGNTALAICYELSVPEHAENAFKNGAEIYVASVAKFVSGMDKALKRLAEIASRYSMTVLMSNCVGECDGGQCAGRSSVWDAQGDLVGQLDDVSEGVLIFDTEAQRAIGIT